VKNNKKTKTHTNKKKNQKKKNTPQTKKKGEKMGGGQKLDRDSSGDHPGREAEGFPYSRKKKCSLGR